MAEKELTKPNVRIIYVKLEDYVERCKKRAVPCIFFTVREAMREDKRISATVELTAMDYQEPANLIFTETRVSDIPIESQEAYDLFRRDFNLRLYGGDVETPAQNNKKEIVHITGIIPYIQGEYSGVEIKAGWIGW